MPSVTVMPTSGGTGTPYGKGKGMPTFTGVPTSAGTGTPSGEGTTRTYVLVVPTPNVGQNLDTMFQLYGDNTDGNGKFVVNLEKFNDPVAKGRRKAAYSKVGEWYSTSPVPVFFVPGNKDWSLCPDPTQALEHFNDQMCADYVAQHWVVPNGYNIIRHKG